MRRRSFGVGVSDMSRSHFKRHDAGSPRRDQKMFTRSASRTRVENTLKHPINRGGERL